MRTKKYSLAFLMLFIALASNAQSNPSFTFPALPYSYDALEPYIDKATMELHYDKHFRAYYNNFIKAVEENGLNGKTFEEIFSEVSKYPVAVRNSGGGYFNHSLFWGIMSPNGGGIPEGKLLQSIVKYFSSYESFVKEFEKAANTLFGSGWVWLTVDDKGKLFIVQLPNQDNPLMDVSPKRGVPILVLDVWEHAYYLKYQNRRAEYVSNFWKVINWKKVNEFFEKAISGKM